MSEVKWFKITTDIFDDEKIKYIESFPESDTLIVIWFKLLSLAARSNQSGYVMLTDKIPYTQEMLINFINRKATVVKMALSTFEQLGMIEVTDENAILISNWEKHQNIEGLDKIREQRKLRQQRFREKQKALETKDEETEEDKEQDIEGNVNNNATHNVTDNVTTKDTEEYKSFVDWFMKTFKGKKQKPARNRKAPKVFEKVGDEHLRRATERYMEECNRLDRYIMNEQTWWNGRYEEYLDDNFEYVETPKDKKNPMKARDDRNSESSAHLWKDLE